MESNVRISNDHIDDSVGNNDDFFLGESPPRCFFLCRLVFSASALISSLSLSGGDGLRWHAILPLICHGHGDAFRLLAMWWSASGHGLVARSSSCPSWCHISSAICGAIGAHKRASISTPKTSCPIFVAGVSVAQALMAFAEAVKGGGRRD